MENREKFSSRLGFLLISAGCAIGLGNVWKFPYITGKYGGAAFVLIYFVFLLILGIPILTLELAVGRASQRSVALSRMCWTEGTKWLWFKFPAMAGNSHPDDVLHHGCRLDGLLFLQDGGRRLCRDERG